LLPIIHWATHNQSQFDNSTISILDVLNNLMKDLFTVKSSDCSILLSGYKLLRHIVGSESIYVSEV